MTGQTKVRQAKIQNYVDDSLPGHRILEQQIVRVSAKQGNSVVLDLDRRLLIRFCSCASQAFFLRDLDSTSIQLVTRTSPEKRCRRARI